MQVEFDGDWLEGGHAAEPGAIITRGDVEFLSLSPIKRILSQTPLSNKGYNDLPPEEESWESMVDGLKAIDEDERLSRFDRVIKRVSVGDQLMCLLEYRKMYLLSGNQLQDDLNPRWGMESIN